MCFPIWLDALLISHKASTLSLSSTGIGGVVDASLNPASLYNIETYMGMSSNKGYIDAKGNRTGIPSILNSICLQYIVTRLLL